MAGNPDELGYIQERCRCGRGRWETVWWLADKSGATQHRDEAGLFTRRAFEAIGPYEALTFVPAIRATPR